MNYQSGPASLFSAITREAAAQPKPEPTASVTVTCSWCLSEEVVLVDNEFQIYKCAVCGEVFSRPF
jgi:ribosomal protein S27E